MAAVKAQISVFSALEENDFSIAGMMELRMLSETSSLSSNLSPLVRAPLSSMRFPE